MSQKYSNSQILSFLRSVGIMSIAVNAEPYPISSVVLFSVDDEFNFLFTTHIASNKAKSLLKRPEISFSVWQHRRMLIQATGQASRITDIAEQDLALDALASASAELDDFWPPILRLDSDEYVAFKIKPSKMRVLDLESVTISAEKLPSYDITL